MTSRDETGPSVLQDDTLAQELIKAQAVERMARDDYTRAYNAMTDAQQNVRQLTAEIAKRAWESAGVVFGETILYVRGRENKKYLAAGVDDFRGDLVVQSQTKTGKWFKRKERLHLVKPSEIVICGKHNG